MSYLDQITIGSITYDIQDSNARASIPSAASATPADLGTAAVGTSTDYARADHVHAMPSATDVGAVSASDVPFKVYDSVEDLGLTVGSATITGAWAAMEGQNAILMCNAAEFAPNSMPSTAGNVMMYRLASYTQRGIIRYYARVPVVGDYAMEIDTSGNASGTWTPLPVGQHAQLSQNQTATFTILGNMGVLFYGRGSNKYAAIITYWDASPLVIVSSGTAPTITHSTNSNTFTVKNTASGAHIAMFLTVPTTYY